MQTVKSTVKLGKIIREKRKNLGFKQTELAGLTGVGTRFISELERGKATCQLGKTIGVVKKLGLVILLGSRAETRALVK